jgi:hypothetical protein
MTGNLFVSEVLFTIIIAIGFLVFWQLKISRNGTLRKIMMAYFLIEIYVYSLSAIYWWAIDRGVVPVPITVFRLVVLIPKAAVKIVLLVWLIKQNRKRKL